MDRGQSAFVWIFQKNYIDNMSWKSQKRQKIVASIFVNTTQYLSILNNNIYYSNNRKPPPFFHSDTNTWPRSGPFCWQNPCSGCNRGTGLVVVLEYIFFQLCFNTEQIPQVHKIQEKLCKSHCCCSNQPLSKLHCFLLDVRCSKWSRSFFWHLFVRTTFSRNLHLVEEENLQCLTILQH